MCHSSRVLDEYLSSGHRLPGVNDRHSDVLGISQPIEGTTAKEQTEIQFVMFERIGNILQKMAIQLQ